MDNSNSPVLPKCALEIREEMCDMFTDVVLSKAIILRGGSIVDPSFCDEPRQRNSRQENETIHQGAIPEEWLAEDPKSKHKLAQKDIDA